MMPKGPNLHGITSPGCQVKARWKGRWCWVAGTRRGMPAQGKEAINQGDINSPPSPHINPTPLITTLQEKAQRALVFWDHHK